MNTLLKALFLTGVVSCSTAHAQLVVAPAVPVAPPVVVAPPPPPVVVAGPPPAVVVPAGVAYVAPVDVAPAPGYLWRYNVGVGWGWWHPGVGWWHAGWGWHARWGWHAGWHGPVYRSRRW
jgi:hypothetical protein